MSAVWSKEIAGLRKAMGLTQAKLASMVGVAQSLVSASESGKRPPAEMFVQLGNVAAEAKLYERAVYFWGEAGVKVERVVPAALELLKGIEAPITQGTLTSVPPSKSLAMKTSKDAPRLSVETAVLSNPLACSYVTVPDESLLPMFKKGDVLILDESELNVANMPSAYVAAARVSGIQRKGEAFARSQREPLRVGWLRAIGPATALDRPNTQGGITSDILSVGDEQQHPEFTILGRVVAWIDMRGKSLPRAKEAPQKTRGKGSKEKKRK